MEKFDSKKHSELITKLPFSYFSTESFLDKEAYILEQNGEKMIVWQDMLYPHDFPSIFLPQKNSNWKKASLALVTPDEIAFIKNENIEIVIDKFVELEYYYKTEDFINPTSKNKRRIDQFVSSYQFKILNDYPKEKVLEFYNFWKTQREHVSISFEEGEEFFLFCLDNKKKYGFKEVYIEIEGKLVGLAFGETHVSGNWTGLHLKVNYSYKGLSRFLQHERAKLFSGKEFFTLGTGAHDLGISQFKEEMGPTYKKEYHYLLTS